MTENIEFPVKPTTEHGLSDSIGPIKAVDEQHAYEVSEAPVGVHVGAGFKAPHPHSITQPLVLQVDYLNVPKGKEKKMNQFVWNFEVAQGMPKSHDGRGGEESDEE
jgi:hypothetical protein